MLREISDVNEAIPLSPIRVFLLIENRLLREALTRLLKKRNDMLVVGQASQENVTPELLIESECAVLTLDFADPQWLPNQFFCDHPNPPSPRFRALLVGMECDQRQFLSAVRAGASGYMLKDASASDVVSAVRATVRGEAICPPRLCATLFQCVSQLPEPSASEPPAGPPNLTLRQRQLVGLVAKGLTNKEIAVQLNLSEFTVRNHIHRILKQIDVRTRREAVLALCLQTN